MALDLASASPPFGFWFRGPGYFPKREEYIHMLDEYRKELEAELKGVERELEELRKESQLQVKC